jgi:hypothetical protein
MRTPQSEFDLRLCSQCILNKEVIHRFSLGKFIINISNSTVVSKYHSLSTQSALEGI